MYHLLALEPDGPDTLPRPRSIFPAANALDLDDGLAEMKERRGAALTVAVLALALAAFRDS